VVLGFPWLSAWALQYTSATRAAVIIALTPFFTAVVSALREGTRPAARFWVGSLLGTSFVVLFLFSSGSGAASPDVPTPILFGRQVPWLPESALALAALLAAVGYTEGTRLTRELGGLQVISWALLGALPLVLALLFVHGAPPWKVPPSAWWGFAYVSLISMFVAFYFWYGGLAQAGITRASQVQLIQPLLSVTWAVLLLGEEFSFGLIVTALGVVTSIVVALRRPRAVSRFPTHAGERASRVEAA
jgi:drug/metabolite transporter (DMT)-like permease